MHRDQLPIAEPCHADWDAMSGNERKRFCGQCSKHVHDLSALRAAEAQVLVQTEPDLCVRYEVEPTGEVRHRAGRRRALRAAVGALLLTTTPAVAAPMVADADGPSLAEGLRDKVLEVLGLQVDEPEMQVMVGAIMVMPPPEEAPWEGVIETLPEMVEVPPVTEPVRPVMGRIRRAPPMPPLTEPQPIDAHDPHSVE